MLLLYHSFLFAAGSCYASFLITIGQRWAGLPCTGHRSQCPVCKKILRWWQLIPILGWLFQLGRCRNCNSPIGILSTASELLCGTCFVTAASLSLTSLILMLITSSCLLIMTATDWQARWIHPALITGLFPLAYFFCPTADQLSLIVTGGIAFPLVLAVITRYLGAGDAEFIIVLFAVAGPFNGSAVLLVACLALLLSTLVYHQRKVPFIPWLSLGIVVVWLANWGLFN